MRYTYGMKWLKVGAVVLCAVVITALGIDAADTMSGSRTTLLGQLISTTDDGGCPAGMIAVPMSNTLTCVDVYEASPSESCPHQGINSSVQSQENINDASCQADSVAQVAPWRNITREQAMSACIRAGKRLLTAEEWYLVAAGTPDTGVCNTDSNSAQPTGNSSTCVSSVGIYDAIGNLWEWVSGDIIEGVYNTRSLPEEGYVTQVDSAGLPVLTSVQPSSLFYEDYFWFSETGGYGILRGGFYGSQSDAGLYATQAKTMPTGSGAGIGFRCGY